MASIRQIRGRLRSIGNTKQIMRAMQLVSGSKLKRAQTKLMQARAVLGFLDGMLQRLLAASGEMTHPLSAVREGPPTLVLFTSDAGLCGSYNTNLIAMAEAYLRRDTARATEVIYIGKKGHRYFTKRGYKASGAYLGLAGRPDMAKADQIGKELMERFLTGKTASIHILYSQFKSATSFKPTVQQWLPIALAQPEADPKATKGPAKGTREAQVEYIFEPSAEQVFGKLLPRWALAKFQLIMLEAFTSEHSGRMIAMKNATDNAEELLKSLTRQRNKIRQASITKEISEIVGTAEALK
jgi:F-type H+-transporting ATPase subunit gamma